MRPTTLLLVAAICIAITLIGSGIAQTPQEPAAPSQETQAAAPTETTVALDLTDMADGTYKLTIDGLAVTCVPLVLIVPGTHPPIDPPIDPDMNARAVKFKMATRLVIDEDKNKTAAGMVKLYESLSKIILDNGLSNYTIIGTLMTKGEAEVLKRQNAEAAWTPVTDLSSAELAKVAATSKAGPGDYAAFFDDAAKGVGSESKIGGIEDWAWLIELLFKILMEWLSEQAGNVPPAPALIIPANAPIPTPIP